MAKPIAPSVSSTRPASGKALLSLSKGTPAHTQHQDVVAIRGLGLIAKQRDGLPGFGQPGQDLAGERFHNRVAEYQNIGQKPGNPLIADVPAIGRPRLLSLPKGQPPVPPGWRCARATWVAT